jgi:predicted O-methyltransferase YrrM
VVVAKPGGTLNREIYRESDVHPHVATERAEHFHTEDGGATEVEYLGLIASLIHVTKPNAVLETGSFTGAGTCAIAAALQTNGFGHCISVERDAATAEQVRGRLSSNGLDPFASIEPADSLDFLRSTAARFDFAFLDSELLARADELRLLVDRRLMTEDGIVAIHDTSRVRELPAGRLDPHGVEFRRRFELIRPRLREVFEFKLSRGMLLIRP